MLAFFGMPDGATLVAGLAAMAAIAGGLAWQRRRAIETSVARLLERDPRWQATTTPCGYDAHVLADWFAPTPAGDRRYGLQHAIEGPLEVQIGGETVTCRTSCFRWWSERARTRDGGRNTRRTSYATERQLAVLVELPVAVPAPIRVGPEGVLGRVRSTGAGELLESSEFNRRFRVEGEDPDLTARLLDAGLQHELVERFQGRSLELSGPLLALGGEPDHRDASLADPIGQMPAAAVDAQRLLDHIPDRFWRAIGVGPTA